MLLDYENLFREMSKAVTDYQISNIPLLFQSADTDYRTLTHLMKKDVDIKTSANKAIGLLLDSSKLDLLVSMQRRGGEEGCKIFPSSANVDQTRKLILLGSETLVSKDSEGKSKRCRFIPLSFLTDEIKKKIQSSRNSYEHFYKTASCKIEEDLNGIGNNFLSQIKKR